MKKNWYAEVSVYILVLKVCTLNNGGRFRHCEYNLFVSSSLRYNKLFVLGPSNAERAVAVAESTNSTIKEFVETLVTVLVCGYVYKLI